MNRKILSRLLIVLLVIGMAAAVGYRYTLTRETPQEFLTDSVRRGNIENVVLANGVLYPSKLVSVGAQVSGMIESMNVKVGDDIREGDLIAQIDNLAQKNTLKEAEASLRSIDAQYAAKQAQIKAAEAEFVRKQRMLKEGATSQAEYDTAESTLAVYRAELDQLSAEREQAVIRVDDATLDLSYTTISSPMDGTVIYASVEEGQTVNTNQGTPSIIELAQLDLMTVKAQVSEADIIHVHPGQEVYFSILGSNGKRYPGVLRAIEPGPTLLTGDDTTLTIGDSEAIYYNALFDVENPDNELHFGMTAQVSIVLESAEDALLVPAQALVKKPGPGDAWQVLVKQGDQAEPRDVEVGINNKVYAQILSGLEEGDEVVVGQGAASGQARSSAPAGRLPGMGGAGMGRGMRF